MCVLDCGMRFSYVVPFCFLIYENKGSVSIPILIRISIEIRRLFLSAELQRRFREGKTRSLWETDCSVAICAV